MQFWFRLAVLSSWLVGACAQATPTKAETAPIPSALDAVLFYQILLGELNVRQGSAGAGFSIMLDAARKSRDPALFQRSVDIALQARSGDAALQAAQTWKKEIPNAFEPNRYILQILLALNRIEEAGQALAVSINELPAAEQSGAIASTPRVFGRVQDKKLAADVVEKALNKALKQPGTAAIAWTTIGRMRLDAAQINAATEAALQGHASDPLAPGPLLLALSLMGTASTSLKPMLDQAMQSQVPPELRLGYARTLIGLQRYSEALTQLEQLGLKHPTFADGWLIHGLLLQENNQPQAAEAKLLRYLDLTAQSKEAEQQAGRAEALLSLAQMAQKRGQFDHASQWLSQVPPDADPVKLASRQADLLSQQGRLNEARLVLAQIKATTPEIAKRKVLAQSQWLREHRQAADAHPLLVQALSGTPNDAELLSELAMVCEKLQRFDEMETALRQLMGLRPQEAHAFNALGYSLADRNIRLSEARQLIEQAVQLSPQDPYIQDSLGWVAFRQGQHQEALRILQAAYKAKPDAEIAAHLGEVLWTLGMGQEAATVWREGLLLKADNETLQETLQRFKFKP